MAIPKFMVSRLAALAILAGLGGGGVFIINEQQQVINKEELIIAQHDPYIVAVSSDASTSEAVKIAMVLGYYYESSGKHIGTPYIDRLGKGQPLTVCNGITGPSVISGKYYTQADCYALERKTYIKSEADAKRYLRLWGDYDPVVQAIFIDFIHNKGSGNFSTSTMLKLANNGDLKGACKQNPRWNKGTVNGVSTILPGLQHRGDTNAEICLQWKLG